MHMTTPSDLFISTLDGGGSASVECQCGILHLCPDNSNYDFDDEPGSWKTYCEEEHKNHPKKVALSYGYDSVSFKEIDGKQYVYDCKCWNTLTRYENWIWSNRQLIRDYLKLRVDRELELAEQEKLLNILMDTKLAV